MASVFRIFLLLVLIGGAFVAAAMFLDKGNPGDNVPSENGAMSEKQGKAQAILDIVEKQAQAKGGTVLDKRVFDGMPNCINALNKVSAEYQRRGIRAENIADATAFLGTEGRATALMEGDKVYILACLDFAKTNSGAGYVQISTSEAQMKQSQAQQ